MVEFLAHVLAGLLVVNYRIGSLETAIKVVPEPAKGSKIPCAKLIVLSISCSMSSTGFCVGCNSFPDRRSVYVHFWRMGSSR